MARSIPNQTRTQVDELRNLLEISYNSAVSIKGAGAEAARDLLYDLDSIHDLFPEFEEQGVDLRAERGRWEEVQGAVRRHASELRRELAPLGGLKTLRQELPSPPSPEDRWWWWLDVTAQKRMRRRVLIFVGAVVGIALLLVVGIWAFNKLFPVDPNVAIAYEHKNNAENFVLAGKLQEAISELEAGYQAEPDDPDILSLLAALYDLTGRQADSQAMIDKLLAKYPPSIVFSNLAQSYTSAGEAEKAMMYAQRAIKEDPANPQGYLMAGMVYESQGDIKSAMDAYQMAADTARAAEDFQTEAFAKIRLATLLQKPQLPASSTAIPGG